MNRSAGSIALAKKTGPRMRLPERTRRGQAGSCVASKSLTYV
uniref:Uncharacterized protein n=1 Tax=Arundo donax TaxID=35708 RepID=A0A0A8ZVS2_ARUDO